MNEEKDELDDFIVDENEPVDKKLLALIIKPYINSIGKNGVIDHTDRFENSPAWKKTLVYLCCRKVMFIKEIIEDEPTGPKIISENTNISLDSAKNISRDKNLKKLVAKDKGKYFISNYKLKLIKEILLENETNS